MNTHPISLHKFIQFGITFGPIDNWYENCENLIFKRKNFLFNFGETNHNPKEILIDKQAGTYLFCFRDENFNSISIFVNIHYTVQKIPIMIFYDKYIEKIIFFCDEKMFFSLDEIINHFHNHLLFPLDVSSYFSWFWEGSLNRFDVLDYFDSYSSEGQFAIVNVTEKNQKDQKFSIFYRKNNLTVEKILFYSRNKFFISEFGLESESLFQIVWQGRKHGIWNFYLSNSSDLNNQQNVPKLNTIIHVNNHHQSLSDSNLSIAEIQSNGEVTLRGGVISRRHKKIYSLERNNTLTPKKRKEKRKSTPTDRSPIISATFLTNILQANSPATKNVDQVDQGGVEALPSVTLTQNPNLENTIISQISNETNKIFYGRHVRKSILLDKKINATISLPLDSLSSSTNYSIQLTCENYYFPVYIKNIDKQSNSFTIEVLPSPSQDIQDEIDVTVHFSVFISYNKV